MRFNFLIIVLGGILTSGLASCTDRCTINGQSGNDLAFTTFQRSATYSLVGSAADFLCDKDVQFYDSVSIVMPLRVASADITALCDSICAYAFDSKPGTSVMAAAATWMRTRPSEGGYKAVSAYAEDATTLGEASVNGFVYTLTPSLLVYCVHSESLEPGAAHGMSSTRYINFGYSAESTLQGVITLHDLFSTKGLKNLPRIIGDRASELFSAIGSTDVEGLPENGNFYINSLGEIVFSYQPYEIASYAQGNIEITFEPYELVDLLSLKGITYFGLEDLND